jgi:hypothetical protein
VAKQGQPNGAAEVPEIARITPVSGLDEPLARWAPRSAARAELLAALIADLGLDRVHVDGHFAVIQGHRATYRVHLTSGSINIEPGGYLCIVPSGFGEQPHRQLFLPFADEDRMTAVILSKVLLLVEDDKITDRSILAQIERAAR